MKKKQDNQIEELKKQTEDWKSKYLRALADYQNLEKRSRERESEVRMYASERVLARLFPVVDTIRKAKDHLKDPGLDLGFKELLAVLEEEGVEKIEVVGQPFNPHEMECIEIVDSPRGEAGGKENEVVEELLSGYRLRGKVLRVAQVKVGRKNEKSTNAQSTNAQSTNETQHN